MVKGKQGCAYNTRSKKYNSEEVSEEPKNSNTEKAKSRTSTKSLQNESIEKRSRNNSDKKNSKEIDSEHELETAPIVRRSLRIRSRSLCHPECDEPTESSSQQPIKITSNQKNEKNFILLQRQTFDTNISRTCRSKERKPTESPQSSDYLDHLSKQDEGPESDSQIITQNEKNSISFRCQTCDMNFSTAFVLKKHKSLVGKLCCFECELCPKKFTRPSVYLNHVKQHDREPNSDSQESNVNDVICGKSSKEKNFQASECLDRPTKRGEEPNSDSEVITKKSNENYVICSNASAVRNDSIDSRNSAELGEHCVKLNCHTFPSDYLEHLKKKHYKRLKGDSRIKTKKSNITEVIDRNSSPVRNHPIDLRTSVKSASDSERVVSDYLYHPTKLDEEPKSGSQLITQKPNANDVISRNSSPLRTDPINLRTSVKSGSDSKKVFSDHLDQPKKLNEEPKSGLQVITQKPNANDVISRNSSPIKTNPIDSKMYTELTSDSEKQDESCQETIPQTVCHLEYEEGPMSGSKITNQESNNDICTITSPVETNPIVPKILAREEEITTVGLTEMDLLIYESSRNLNRIYVTCPICFEKLICKAAVQKHLIVHNFLSCCCPVCEQQISAFHNMS